MSILDELKARLGQATALGEAGAVLGWDQQTYMPPGAAHARANQLAAISTIVHDMATDDRTRSLLERSEAESGASEEGSDDWAYLRMARRDFDHAVKLPSELVADMARTTALAHEQWVTARATNDYGLFAPWLEKILDLNRQVADHLGYKQQRYDALLDQYEPGMLAADVRAMFDSLKPDLVALVKAIVDKGPDYIDTSILSREYDESKQLAFGERVIRHIGFDFNRGRQDRAVHPFCTSFSRDDVRITTRFDKNFPPMALFGTIHETGHALYEQGVAARYDSNVLGGGASLGVHESQSRLWENLIGRSRPFWKFWYGDLRSTFPSALGNVDREDYYRAINQVAPSLVRVEADEVTYNLHILLRFELEMDLLDGRLSVNDAPAAWNRKMEEYLGLTPPDDRVGILQDVHWSGGSIGYFPTYSVGNLLSVQLYDKANADLGGNLEELVAAGDFAPLLSWLRENIHQWGRKYLPTELVLRATGKPLSAEPYKRYLKEKFGEVYGL